MLLLAWLALAPRPLDRGDPLAGDGPQAESVATVEHAARELAARVMAEGPGDLAAGWAAVEFALPAGVPLAGKRAAASGTCGLAGECLREGGR